MRALYTVPGSETPRELTCEGFVEREFGERVADRVAREMEYEPNDDVLVV